MQLLQYFLLLLPYKVTTLSTSLSKPEVIVRLSDRFIPEAVLGGENFWIPISRYVGHDLEDCFQIDGPFGNKRWTLSAEIKIAPTSQGSTLKLRLLLSPLTLFCAMLVLGIYGIGSIFLMQFPFWKIIILQELFLYSIIVFVFNSEVETLLNLVKEVLKKTA